MIDSINLRSNRLFAGLTVAASVLVTPAQPPGQTSREPFPAPVNLKVLPTNLTGAEVHDLMKQWTRDLGVRCVACHVQDSDAVVTGGSSPRFADDSKPMKQTARLMYTMTEEINKSYIAKVDGRGMPVTCATCHRGNVYPEPFVAVPRDPQNLVRASSQAVRPSMR